MAFSKEDVAKIFPKMVEHFDPAQAEGVDALIQFALNGDNGGMYWLQIGDGRAQVGQGEVENARMTLVSTADDFANMMMGTTNPMQAFMTGKIKIKGDTSLALKLMPLINGIVNR
jgi:putative sterol carrier protein